MHKLKSKLAFQFVIGMICLGMLIGCSGAMLGYFQFKKNIERQYNDTAYQIAEVAASYLPEHLLEKYYRIAKDSSYCQEEPDVSEEVATLEYQALQRDFKKLKEKMQARDIYLVYVNQENLLSYSGDKTNWYPITYILDCFEEIVPPFQLGSKGAINPKFIQEAYQIVTTGERSSCYFISESFHGYNTSALLPIPVEDEYLILGVEIPMHYITQALTEYVQYVVSISLSITLAVIVIYLLYFYSRVFHPLQKITKEVEGFVQHVAHPSKDLLEIRVKNEIGGLAKSIWTMEEDLIHYIEQLTQVTKNQERLSAELAIASQIQMSMLPTLDAFTSRFEFELYAFMIPAKEVGGDFYDFFLIDEQHLAIVVADVSGKGIPASLFMVIGKTLLRETIKQGLALEDAFTKVNALLCESNQKGLFITAFAGILDLATGGLVYANAGHELPFIYRKGQGFLPYPMDSEVVLAGFEDTQYSQGFIQLEEGDKIFQYTDGVTEALNESNTLYGMKRLEQALNQAKEKTVTKVVHFMHSEILLFAESAPQADDITMLCLEFKKKNETLEKN